MKKINFLVLVLFCCMFCVSVNAANSGDSVGSNLTEYSCSKFQDSNMLIDNDTYFGRCMKATCSGNRWKFSYYSTESVSCSNGNLNPYITVSKSGCDDYQNSSCTGTVVKYCTTLNYFDCNRTANGSKYVKPTKKVTKTTTVAPTTEAPTTAAPLDNNTYLSSLKVSSGSINFNKEVKEYSIEVESTISSINVEATAESGTSTVSGTGSVSLSDGVNTVTITVTAQDGSTANYVININRKEVLSKNAKLASLTVDGYDINFDPDTYNYSLKIKKESTLSIEATTEDSSAIYMVQGNENLKNNSMIKVVVTAPDGATTQEYTITVRKSGNGAVVIVILVLILAIGGGVAGFYFYTRKKNAGDKEYEYE